MEMAIFGGGNSFGAVGAMMSLLSYFGMLTFSARDFGAELNKLFYDFFSGDL